MPSMPQPRREYVLQITAKRGTLINICPAARRGREANQMKPALRPLGLYIHIPFCRQKCSYCDFYSLAGREDRMDDYTAALRAHLAEAAPFVSGYTVDTVYFGGGTPSCLGEKRLARLLKLIEKKF